MKINKKILIDELDLPYEALEDDITGTSRWTVNHTIVFEYKDKFYRAAYRQGATEMQDEYPWEYEDEVECIEVHQVEKLVKVWELVNEL